MGADEIGSLGMFRSNAWNAGQDTTSHQPSAASLCVANVNTPASPQASPRSCANDVRVLHSASDPRSSAPNCSGFQGGIFSTQALELGLLRAHARGYERAACQGSEQGVCAWHHGVDVCAHVPPYVYERPPLFFFFFWF